jgi:transitional endoplasmic reticulum ATPase
LNPKESDLRPDREATSPILWVLFWVCAQFGRFLRDGYNEIRQLVSANTPQGVKRVFTASLLALVLALAAVGVIASQIHPAAVILAVALVLLMVYGHNLFRRMALFVGYMFCGVILFIGAGLVIVGPIEKAYPTFAKVVAVFLFVVLCLVIPALLSAKEAIATRPAGGSTRKAALTFADVGGLEEAKQQIRELVQANLDGRRLGKYGVCRNGILLHGPRGTGKTFLAEAVAGEFSLKFLSVPAATLHARWVGETERRIELLFEEAIASRPALLFFDEIDALGAKRQQIGDGEDPGGAGRGYNSATSQLMICIDRTRSESGLIVAAATNFYDGLDRALIREGRFDLHLRLDLPNEEDRARMFEAQLANRPASRFDLQPFARRTPGWSAAKISTLVDRAAVFAAQERRKIEEKDLARALAETGGKDRAAFKEVDWDDVVLPMETEADLRALVRLMDPAYSERLKLPVPSGLLIGPPGTGKTMIARLIATQTKRSFYPVTAADILGGATGASVKKLADLFARAKENSPSIIFIDEMDGLLPRNTGLQSQHDIQVVEQVRSLISELEPAHNVFLVGATNHLDSIDPAILRGGRFSEKLEIGLPDEVACARLLARHLDGSRLADGLRQEDLAERLTGIAPADLEAVCGTAKRMAMRRMAPEATELPPLNGDDFTEAMERVRLQP